MTGQRLYASLTAAAEMRPNQLAITFLDHELSERAYTFDDLFSRVSVVASRIRDSGLAAGRKPVGLLLQSQESQTVHYLAALEAGVVPAILTPPNRKLDRELYARTMRTLLSDARFGAVVSDVPEVASSVPVFSPYDITPTGDVSRPSGAAPSVPERTSFIQFSSGTTGIKRGVHITDEAVLEQLGAYGKALDVNEADVIVSWLPLYHDMGFISCLHLPLLHGLHTVMIDPIDWVTRPGMLLQAVTRFKGTLSWNPNFAYAFMAQRIRDSHLDELDLSSLRALVNCSEPVKWESQRIFEKRFADCGLPGDVFKGCYAMAETTFALTHGEPTSPLVLDHEGPRDVSRSSEGDPYVSVGRPLPGVEISIRDEHHEPLGDRELGELWVRSPFTFSGYLAEQEATQTAFVDGWYRTGDLGYRVEDEVFVTGRRKDVMIIGGVNVFAEDVEGTVGSLQGIHPGRVVAFAVQDDRVGTERVIVLAEAMEDAPGGLVIEARRHVQASLQISNLEVHLVPVGWLAKSSSGKLARAENRQRWLTNPPA